MHGELEPRRSWMKLGGVSIRSIHLSDPNLSDAYTLFLTGQTPSHLDLFAS